MLSERTRGHRSVAMSEMKMMLINAGALWESTENDVFRENAIENARKHNKTQRNLKS